MYRERIREMWFRLRYRRNMAPEQIWNAGWEEVVPVDAAGRPDAPAPQLSQLLGRLTAHDSTKPMQVEPADAQALVALLRELEAWRAASRDAS